MTITGVADNLSDGDQSYAILLTDNTTAIPATSCGSGCLVEEPGSDRQGQFYVSAVSNDTDESTATATFTVRLASEQDVTIGVTIGYR